MVRRASSEHLPLPFGFLSAAKVPLYLPGLPPPNGAPFLNCIQHLNFPSPRYAWRSRGPLESQWSGCSEPRTGHPSAGGGEPAVQLRLQRPECPGAVPKTKGKLLLHGVLSRLDLGPRSGRLAASWQWEGGRVLDFSCPVDKDKSHFASKWRTVWGVSRAQGPSRGGGGAPGVTLPLASVVGSEGRRGPCSPAPTGPAVFLHQAHLGRL